MQQTGDVSAGVVVDRDTVTDEDRDEHDAGKGRGQCHPVVVGLLAVVVAAALSRIPQVDRS